MHPIEQHYRENRDKLVNVVKRRVGNNHAIAEECVQEAYARAWQYFGSFNEAIKPFNAWFNTILNNTVNTTKKIERDRGISLEETGDIFEDDSLGQDYEHLIHTIDKDIDKVANEGHKEILKLHFVHEMKPSEIFFVTEGYTQEAIKKVVQRFRGELVDKYAGSVKHHTS